MIPRYNRPEIEKIWSLKNKFSIWTDIECLIAEKQAQLGVIPKKAAIDIKKKAISTIDKIYCILACDLSSFLEMSTSTHSVGFNSLVKAIFIT